MHARHHHTICRLEVQDCASASGEQDMPIPLNQVRTAIRMQIVDELREVQQMLTEDWDTNLNTSALMLAAIALKLTHAAISR